MSERTHHRGPMMGPRVQNSPNVVPLVNRFSGMPVGIQAHIDFDHQVYRFCQSALIPGGASSPGVWVTGGAGTPSRTVSGGNYRMATSASSGDNTADSLAAVSNREAFGLVTGDSNFAGKVAFAQWTIAGNNSNLSTDELFLGFASAPASSFWTADTGASLTEVIGFYKPTATTAGIITKCVSGVSAGGTVASFSSSTVSVDFSSTGAPKLGIIFQTTNSTNRVVAFFVNGVCVATGICSGTITAGGLACVQGIRTNAGSAASVDISSLAVLAERLR